MSRGIQKPIGIFYEHPDWFRPLFGELDRRDLPYRALRAAEHTFDPGGNGDGGLALVFNRMSPSAYQRGAAGGIFYTLDYLRHLERNGLRVVNGARAYQFEISKAAQLSLLQRLGLPYPPARVIHSPEQAPGAAAELSYPVIVKPNVGGSGAGIRRFDEPEALNEAVRTGELNLGFDRTALVQRYVAPEAGRIMRVEVVGGRFLYAIRVYSSADTFDLCPADACRGTDGRELSRSACAVDAPDNDLRVEGFTPPRDVIDDVERITEAAGIEVGGVEYLIDERTGERLYYDINALSNFVADAPLVVGLDPHAKLVDYLLQEAY